MPGSTPRGYPYPLGTEPADGAPHIEALARAVDTDNTAIAKQSIPSFANAAARDAAIPAPVSGQMAFLKDLNQLQVHRIGPPGITGWFPTGGITPGGKVMFGTGGPFSAGMGKINLTPLFTGALTWGGVTYNPATGAFTVPAQGWYQISASIAFVSVTGNTAQTLIGNESAAVTSNEIEGTWAAKTAASEHFSVLSGMFGMAAGTKLALWYNVPATTSMARGQLSFHWINS